MTEEELIQLVKEQKCVLKSVNNKEHNAFLNRCFPFRNGHSCKYIYYYSMGSGEFTCCLYRKDVKLKNAVIIDLNVFFSKSPIFFLNLI